jgi:hypothetical protein
MVDGKKQGIGIREAGNNILDKDVLPAQDRFVDYRFESTFIEFGSSAGSRRFVHSII